MEYHCVIVGDPVVEPAALLRLLLGLEFPPAELRKLKKETVLSIRTTELRQHRTLDIDSHSFDASRNDGPALTAYTSKIGMPTPTECSLTMPNPSMPSVDITVHFSVVTETNGLLASASPENLRAGHDDLQRDGMFSLQGSSNNLESFVKNPPHAIIVTFTPFSSRSFARMRMQWTHFLHLCHRYHATAADSKSQTADDLADSTSQAHLTDHGLRNVLNMQPSYAGIASDETGSGAPHLTALGTKTTYGPDGTPTTSRAPLFFPTSSDSGTYVTPAVILVGTRYELLRESFETIPAVFTATPSEICEVAQTLGAKSYFEISNLHWDSRVDELRRVIARSCVGETHELPVIDYATIADVCQESVNCTIAEIQEGSASDSTCSEEAADDKDDDDDDTWDTNASRAVPRTTGTGEDGEGTHTFSRRQRVPTALDEMQAANAGDDGEEGDTTKKHWGPLDVEQKDTTKSTWTWRLNKANNRVFYANRRSGKTQYERPADYDGKSPHLSPRDKKEKQEPEARTGGPEETGEEEEKRATPTKSREPSPDDAEHHVTDKANEGEFSSSKSTITTATTATTTGAGSSVTASARRERHRNKKERRRHKGRRRHHKNSRTSDGDPLNLYDYAADSATVATSSSSESSASSGGGAANTTYHDDGDVEVEDKDEDEDEEENEEEEKEEEEEDMNDEERVEVLRADIANVDARVSDIQERIERLEDDCEELRREENNVDEGIQRLRKVHSELGDRLRLFTEENKNAHQEMDLEELQLSSAVEQLRHKLGHLRSADGGGAGSAALAPGEEHEGLLHQEMVDLTQTLQHNQSLTRENAAVLTREASQLIQKRKEQLALHQEQQRASKRLYEATTRSSELDREWARLLQEEEQLQAQKIALFDQKNLLERTQSGAEGRQSALQSAMAHKEANLRQRVQWLRELHLVEGTVEERLLGALCAPHTIHEEGGPRETSPVSTSWARHVLEELKEQEATKLEDVLGYTARCIQQRAEQQACAPDHKAHLLSLLQRARTTCASCQRLLETEVKIAREARLLALSQQYGGAAAPHAAMSVSTSPRGANGHNSDSEVAFVAAYYTACQGLLSHFNSTYKEHLLPLWEEAENYIATLAGDCESGDGDLAGERAATRMTREVANVAARVVAACEDAIAEAVHQQNESEVALRGPPSGPGRDDGADAMVSSLLRDSDNTHSDNVNETIRLYKRECYNAITKMLKEAIVQCSFSSSTSDVASIKVSALEW